MYINNLFSFFFCVLTICRWWNSCNCLSSVNFFCCLVISFSWNCRDWVGKCYNFKLSTFWSERTRCFSSSLSFAASSFTWSLCSLIYIVHRQCSYIYTDIIKHTVFTRCLKISSFIAKTSSAFFLSSACWKITLMKTHHSGGINSCSGGAK